MGNSNMKNTNVTMFFVILTIMFSYSTSTQSFLKIKTTLNENNTIEDACKSFKFLRNNHLEATCNGKKFQMNFDLCLGFKNKAIVFMKNGMMNDDCSKYKIKATTDTNNNRKQRLFFEAMCYYIPEDDDLDEEEIMSIIYLNDFLFFNGRELLCRDNISSNLLSNKSTNNVDSTCKDLHLKHTSPTSKNMLVGVCDKKINRADIDICIGNDNSFFSKGNKFSHSCQFCEVKHLPNNTNALQCTCKDKRKRTRRTSDLLSKYLMYVGQKLQCNNEKVIEEIKKKKAEEKAKKKAVEEAKKKAEEEAKKKKAIEEAKKKKSNRRS